MCLYFAVPIDSLQSYATYSHISGRERKEARGFCTRARFSSKRTTQAERAERSSKTERGWERIISRKIPSLRKTASKNDFYSRIKALAFFSMKDFFSNFFFIFM
ncbi:hypothetical protein B9Z55_022245 [Caenorhabditis nigoni]|uniref:Uncharacterized protein n=1 Tax=Caenorhabditis nigoni TaxID=1611254 RepID=A0A2G5SJW5_9PELO|nr:hypothetical protein B9Z55_022245 [Caenorhabditis nigoni]